MATREGVMSDKKRRKAKRIEERIVRAKVATNLFYDSQLDDSEPLRASKRVRADSPGWITTGAFVDCGESDSD